MPSHAISIPLRRMNSWRHSPRFERGTVCLGVLDALTATFHSGFAGGRPGGTPYAVCGGHVCLVMPLPRCVTLVTPGGTPYASAGAMFAWSIVT